MKTQFLHRNNILEAWNSAKMLRDKDLEDVTVEAFGKEGVSNYNLNLLWMLTTHSLAEFTWRDFLMGLLNYALLSYPDRINHSYSTPF